MNVVTNSAAELRVDRESSLSSKIGDGLKIVAYEHDMRRLGFEGIPLTPDDILQLKWFHNERGLWLVWSDVLSMTELVLAEIRPTDAVFYRPLSIHRSRRLGSFFTLEGWASMAIATTASGFLADLAKSVE